MSIPDHDGRPPNEEALRELEALLTRIDGERRLAFAPGGRRLMRALACMLSGDEVGLWREVMTGAREVADEVGLRDFEVSAMTEPARRRLTRRRGRPN